MSNLVIVAIPAEDDYVHQISSQKVPHLTLLFLGEVNKVKNLGMILDFVGHAAERSLTRFGLDVDRRGELGEDKADVLFFSKSKWSGFETLKDYRSYLLQDNNIRTAYDSAEQFPEFNPHLTLGYPDTPAKPDKRDYPGTSYVNFDRIAVWVEEFEGIEFPLRTYDWDAEVAMSEITMSKDVDEVVDDILTHYGKKGMRWGVRTRSTGPQGVTVRDKGKKLKTSGGKGFKAHPDAVRARTLGQKGKKSGLKALSNKDLEEFNKRLNLEQNAKRLTFQDKSKGAQFVQKLLGKGATKGVDEGVKASINSPFAKKKIAKGMAALALT